jgi:hypothetical protein
MQMSRDGTAGFCAFCISALQPPLADEIRRLPVAPALLSGLCFDLPAVAGEMNVCPRWGGSRALESGAGTALAFGR